jgi:excisionase family DNA binding protein
MRTRSEAHPEAIAFSIEDAARRLSVGRSTVYELIGAKALRTIHVGRRILVPESELRRFIAERMEAAA